MVAKKRKSKRQTLQQKYKIVKRVKEHHKRIKKGVLTGRTIKKKNDDRIPSSWPYKEDLLKEIQVAKDKMEDFKLKQKEKKREAQAMKRKGASSTAAMDVDIEEEEETKPRSNLLLPQTTNESSYEVAPEDSIDMNYKNLGQNSRRAFLGELRKVVERADVILQVLDARDPQGTMSTAVQEMVLSNHRKKLVYVLNKADLVPKDVLAGWLKFLRKSFPTIPFKCNTQNQKGNLGQSSGKVGKTQESALQTNHAVGAEELLGLLKNYSRVGDSKSIISVGIVGFPNVGKSSLINSLMRTRAVAVSSMPGFTKVAQEVILDKNIRLIDSPGIVFADGDSCATALRNCVNVEEMEDIHSPIQAILERVPQPYLMQVYGISKFEPNNVVAFLSLVARATGKLKKGGVPNTDNAGRTILHDWNNGKIKYYCRPPVLPSGGGAGEADSKIVSSFSAALDIDGLKEEDMRVLDDIHAGGTTDRAEYVAMDAVGGSLEIRD